MGISDAFTQMFVVRVIGEALELLLNCLGEFGIGDDRVFWCFGGEFRVEVGDVEDGFLGRVLMDYNIDYLEIGNLRRWA